MNKIPKQFSRFKVAVMPSPGAALPDKKGLLPGPGPEWVLFDKFNGDIISEYPGAMIILGEKTAVKNILGELPKGPGLIFLAGKAEIPNGASLPDNIILLGEINLNSPAAGILIESALENLNLKKEIESISGSYTDIFENCKAPVFLMDENLKICKVNSAFNKLFGKRVESLTGKKYNDLFHGDFYELAQPESHSLVPRAVTLKRKGKSVINAPMYLTKQFSGGRMYYQGRLKINMRGKDLFERANFENTLLDTIPNPVFYKDSELKYQGCNQLFADRIIGLPLEDITGKTVFNLPESIPPALAQAYDKKDRELLKKKGAQQYEAKVKCADGIYRDYLLHKSTFNDSDGEVAGIVGVMWDITERGEFERTLKESELKFRSIFEQSQDGIILLNGEGQIVEWNRGAEKIFRIERAEAVDKFWWDIQYTCALESRRTKDYYNLNKQALVEFFRNRKAPWANELSEDKIQSAGGDIRSVQSALFPIEAGENFMACLIVRDITEDIKNKELLQQTAEELKELEQIINKSPAIAFLRKNEPGWPVEFVSKNIIQLGYGQSDFYSGKLCYENIIHPGDLQRVRSEAEAYNKKGRVEYMVEYRIITKYGEPRYVDDHTWIRRGKSGKVTALQGIIIDVTERKNAQLQLASSNKYLQLLSKCNIELIRSNSEIELMIKICQIISEVGEYGYACIAFSSAKEPGKIDIPAAWGDIEGKLTLTNEEIVRQLNFRYSLFSMAQRNKEAFVARQGDKKESLKTFRDTMRAHNVKAFAQMPLYTVSAKSGALIILSEKDRDFDKDELEHLSEIADNLSYGLSYLRALEDMKRIENDLRLSEKKFKSVVQELIDGIAVVDENGKIILWNKALENILGIPEKKIIGKYIWDFQYEIYPDNLKGEETYENIKSLIGRYLKKGIPRNVDNYYEREYTLPGGEKKILQGNLLSVITDRGHTLVSIARDVTSQKKAEHEIRELNAELEQRVIERTSQLEKALSGLKMEVAIRQRMTDELRLARDELHKALDKEKELNELKNRFISMISHEYRTPLTIILSSVNLVERLNAQKEFEKSVKYTRKIRKAVKNLASLLEGVLTISKSDAGKIAPNSQNTDINSLCEEIIEDVNTISERPCQIRFDFKCETREYLTDREMLRHILINLLTNAVKYSPGEPEIKFAVRCENESLIFTVKDKGIGIPQESQKLLFGLFYRGENVETIQGAGLGLSIVKRFTDLLGGGIKVESELGKGAKFTVNIPLSTSR